jgi:hypothetical protein
MQPRFLLNLDHGRHVIEQVDRTSKVLERVQVVWGVLGDELDIVKHSRVPHEFEHGWPGTQEPGAERGLSIVKKLT